MSPYKYKKDNWLRPTYLFCIQMIRGPIHKIKLTFLHFEWWNEVDGALHILPSGKRRKGVFCYPKKRNKSFTIRLLALKGLFDAVHSISRGGTKKQRISVFKRRSEIGLCCVILVLGKHKNKQSRGSIHILDSKKCGQVFVALHFLQGIIYYLHIHLSLF